MELRKHLDALGQDGGWQSPLSVIAHLDLDAFYAQCQAGFAKVAPEIPLGCRQWNNLIAVNYPAREFGIKRGVSVTEARQKCPEIQLPHVPVYVKGRRDWFVPAPGGPLPDSETHKVSLDLFRRESRKIFRIFRSNFSIVEKAGIDEGFVNLGPQVLAKMLEIFPELHEKSTELPVIPEDIYERVSWAGQLPIVANGTAPFNCWHDVVIAVGSQLVAEVRAEVHRSLQYNCSAGIGSTKLIAKLGSARHKPCNQTVVPQSLAPAFMDEHVLGDVWGWGGKLGKSVVQNLDLPEQNQFSKIREMPLTMLNSKLGVTQAAALLRVAEGSDQAEVFRRTTVKSLASVKNFGKPLSTKEDVSEWLIVYCSDLAGRLIDIEEDENLQLRPRVLSVSFARRDGIHSKQRRIETLAAVPSRDLYQKLLTEVSKLVDEVLELPARYLAIELSRMEKLVTGGGFFASEEQTDDITTYQCARCGRRIEQEQRLEHEDYHMALALQKEANKKDADPKPVSSKIQKVKPSPGRNRTHSAQGKNNSSIKSFFK